MSAVDLFCGMGGFSCGLRQAGIDVKLGIDVDECAIRVYRANKFEALQMDLRNVRACVDAIRAVSPDIICGSPPCQDFSCSGKRVEHERAHLTITFVEIAIEIKPRIIVIENVTTLVKSKTWQIAKSMLESGGYNISSIPVNSAACGVAQVRRRMFVFAALSADLHGLKQEAKAYQKTPANPPCVSDFILRETYFYPARNMHSHCVRSAFLPAPTFRCNCLANKPQHYQHRHDDAGEMADAHLLSIAECAAISSFPDDYKIRGIGRLHAGRLLGNCVPPGVSNIVGLWCLKLLQSPANHVFPEKSVEPVPKPRHRISRLQKLINTGMKVDTDGVLRYTCGGPHDAAVLSVLGFNPHKHWELVVKHRKHVSPGVPLDDWYVYIPGVEQPFRSWLQILRFLNRTH